MKLGLRWRLALLFVVVVVLVTSATTAVALQRETADLRKSLLEEDRAQADALAGRIGDLLSSSMRALSATAGLVDEGRLRPEPDVDYLAALFDPLVAANRDFSALAFVAADGAPILVRPADGLGTTSMVGHPAFVEALAGGGAVLSLEPAAGPPLWAVPLPVAPAEYVVVALLSETRLEEILATALALDAEVAFVASNGAPVAATTPTLDAAWLAARWERLAANPDGALETDAPAGDGTVLATAAAVGDDQGAVVVLGSTAEIAALQARLVRSALLTGAAVAGAGIVLGIVVAALIARPVDRLRRATRDMAQGRLDTQAEPSGAREFHELAADFNAMAASLAGQQRSLAASEERHRTLVENAPVGIYRTTPDGRVLMANPALARMLGYATPAEYMARNLESGPYDPAYSRAEWKRRLEAAGEIRGLESAWRRSDGSAIVVRESTKVVRDDAGRTLYYEGTVEDVTERRRAEQAMRSAQERLESFVANSPDAILIADLDLTVRKVNSAFERIFGWRADEVVGHSLPTIPPDRVEELAERIDRVRRGEAIPAAESVRVRKDGVLLPVSTALTPVKDSRGVVVGFAAVVRDISESKRADRALKESERRFRALSQHAFEGIAIHRDGRLLEANRAFAALFGYSARELRGRGLLGLVAPKSLKVVEQHLRMPDDEPYEILCRRKDGTTFPVEIMARTIPYANGTARVTAVRDISERRTMERAVEKRRKLEEENRRIELANRMKGEFLANMSHELRTPMNAILGFSEVLRSGGAGPVTDEQREFLGDIVASGKHLLGLINDVLDLAKVEAGRISFRPESQRAALLVDEVFAGLRALAEPKRVRVEVEVAAEVDEVVVDPARFRQVLYNYASNAIKFTPERGHVWIRVLPQGEERFRVEVEDDGIGIRAFDLPKLFQEFQQLDQTTAKRYGGTGLGLALTKKLVEAQGGSVGVTSVHGKGSTFHAVLPRDTRPFVSGAAPLPREAPPARGSGSAASAPRPSAAARVEGPERRTR